MYGIFTYIYHKNQPNVGKYTSPMDAMGLFCTASPLRITSVPRRNMFYLKQVELDEAQYILGLQAWWREFKWFLMWLWWLLWWFLLLLLLLLLWWLLLLLLLLWWLLLLLWWLLLLLLLLFSELLGNSDLSKIKREIQPLCFRWINIPRSNEQSTGFW